MESLHHCLLLSQLRQRFQWRKLNDVPVSTVDEIEVLLSEDEAVELPVGPIPIPAGQHQLRVEIRDERGLIPCDHLRVGPPGFAWL